MPDQLVTRRGWLIVAVLLVLTVTAAGFRAAPVARADGGMATVSPGAGSLNTLFSFSVSGMTPGHSVLITLFDGAGNRYTYQKDGIDQAIVVDDAGTALMQLTPGRDLAGAAAGTWHAVFTEEESGDSATIDFDVSR